MSFPIFAITDGTDENRIDLLKLLTMVDFKSSVIEPQGGTWGSTPFSDGRVPIAMQLGNLMIEATLSAKGCNQDDVAYLGQRVRQLLENARQYWLSPSWKTPIWVEMRGSSESNIRYAYIYDYRAPGSGNPFAAPLFDGGRAMQIFPLVLEATPWQSKPAGTYDCIEVSNLQENRATITSDTFTFDDIFDDPFVTTPGDGVFLASMIATIGSNNGYKYDYYNKFHDITIPKGSIIISAFIRYTATSNHAATPVNVIIRGERNAFPEPYCDDYDTCFTPPSSDGIPAAFRVYTDNQVDWNNVAAFIANNTYDTPDISDIVQEIINLDNWESGCDMALDIYCAPGLGPIPNNNHRALYTYSSGFGVGKEPVLHIEYVAPSDVGRSATCTKEVLISNKHNQAQITHIFRYEDTGGTYTDLMAAGVPYQLFPAAPAVGDRLYIGIDSTLPGAGPFRSFVLDLSSIALDLEFTVNYSQTAAFAVIAAYTDNTNFLGELGVSSYHFQQPWDFDHQTINAVDAWWVMIEITSVGANFSVPTQQNRQIYTIVTPYFDMDHAQVKGDLPLLARTLLYNRAYSSLMPSAYVKKLFLATRRLSRGEDFTPYLNASDWQLPPGVTYTASGRLVQIEDVDVGAPVVGYGSPTGKMTWYDTPGGTLNYPLEVGATWTFAYNIARQYAGRYAAYLRCATSGSNSNSEYSFALQICYGIAPNYTTYQTKTTRLSGNALFNYIDTFSIMEDLMEGEFLADFHINLLMGVDGVDPNYVFIFDVVLVPIDEFIYVAETDFDILAAVAPPNGNGVYIDVDSILNPKVFRSTVRREDSRDYIANLNRLSRNPWLLNPRTTQRVWFFSPGSLEISHAVQQYGVSRYFDLRGSD